MVSDDIFSVILKHRLPLRRGNVLISDFLSAYFKEYISDLENAVYNRQKNFLRNECYSLLANKIQMIKELCDDIIKSFTLYDSADIASLHQHFYEMMRKIENYLYIERVGSMGNERIRQLYRIRTGNSQYNRLDLFHIPMEKRHLIKSYRYSIPGYPCLYLSTGVELCWFECGMPKKFNYSLFQLDIPEDQTIKLISFNRQPVDLVSSVEIWYYNNPEDRDKIDNYLLQYLITYPLRAACSVQVSDRSNVFIQEYIIPQLLLLWVRKNNEFDGIAYSSCSAIEKAHEWNYCNVVFPAKELEGGYCKRLSGLFKITKPVKVEICNLFKSRSSEIEKVRDYVAKLENKYFNGRSLYLYREILSLCKSFLLLFDCLSTDNYSDAQHIYQTMDTLNLMSYLITTHTDDFKKHAIYEAKTLFYGVESQKIENEFLQVVNDFTEIVKPILFELWGYAIRISCDTQVDYSSLEKIK